MSANATRSREPMATRPSTTIPSNSGSDVARKNDTSESDLEKASEQQILKKDDRNDYDPSPPDSARFKDRIAHFTWPWFATTMSTGAVAVVLAQTPNRFAGLQTIGKIFFILDLVIFALFTIAMSLRAFWYPRRFLESLHHPVEGLFFGSYFVSISLILNATQAYGVPSCGPWLVVALRVCFWIYCAVVLIVGVGQYYVLFQEERLRITDAVPAWIFPIYPLLVIGPMAGQFIPSQPPSHGYDMWIGAVMLQGLAWTVALMMYSMYTQRLMTSALPAPSTRPGMYVSVGPAGYTSAGLIALGMQAPKVLPANLFGVGGTPTGEIVRVLGVMSGLFIIIFSFWFFCVSTVGVVAGIRRMSFTLNWWAFVFPNAGMTLAAIQMGKAFASPAINGICSALTILLVIMWLITAAFHIRAVWLRRIMWPGKDEDKDMKGIGWGRYSA